MADTSNCTSILEYIDTYQTKNKSSQALLSIQRSKCYLKDRSSLNLVPGLLAPIIDQYGSKKDSLSQYFTARALEITGHYYYKSQIVDSSIYFLNKSSDFYLKSNDFPAVFYNYNMVGSIYQSQSSYGRALENYHKALDLFNYHTIDSSYYVDLMIDVGSVYEKYSKYEKSIEVYNTLLSLPDKHIPEDKKADIYNNLGINYFAIDSLFEAYEYFVKASKLYENQNSVSNLALTYNNLATLEYEYHSDTAMGIYYYKKSLELKEEIGNIRGIARSSLNLARIYLALDSIEKSELYALKALELYESLNRIEELSETHYFLTYLYEKQGDYVHALDHSYQHKTYSDSLLSMIKEQQVKEIEQNFALESKLLEVENIAKEKQLIEERLYLNRIINISIVILIIIIIGFFAYYIYVLKNNQKVKNSIHQKNLALTSFASLVKGQEEERKRLAQDLHDGVGNSLALLSMKVKQNNNKEAHELVSTISKEIRSISHNLMPDILEKLGFKEALKELCNQWSTKELFIDLQFKISESSIGDKPKHLSVYRILQELLKNSIERGEANYISIQFKDYSNHVLLIFQDNGRGFSTESTIKGIGLKNIKSRIDSLNGKLNLSTNEDGSSFYISIPKDPKNST